MSVLPSPGPFAHWMLREIYEQPAALAATLEEYVAGGEFRVERCAPVQAWLGRVRTKIVIAASGSSRHAGLAGDSVTMLRRGRAPRRALFPLTATRPPSHRGTAFVSNF